LSQLKPREVVVAVVVATPFSRWVATTTVKPKLQSLPSQKDKHSLCFLLLTARRRKANFFPTFFFQTKSTKTNIF
jgi:hypothetical protein